VDVDAGIVFLAIRLDVLTDDMLGRILHSTVGDA
jgi:hypothetical protein